MKIFRQRAWAITLLASLTALYLIRNTISATSTILLLPLRWHQSSTPPFVINADDDHFDITFANYSRNQITSEPDYPDLVPSILHHIQLGSGASRPEWQTARQSCLKLHPGWQAYLWTDENAATFVQEKFPELWDTWCRYRFPIQRIDALRYMVLQHYGGVVLDLDLECMRSLGPLRRFGFVAPAAHPTGFSIGFMMAAKNHPFVWELVRNLPAFDKRWFGLPYPTVMFSTGCHYASSLHAKQRQRSDLRILAGTIENPDLHRLNGNVVTPLFHHLGTSSWHSFDAELIVKLGHAHIMHKLRYLSAVLVIMALLVTWCRVRKTRQETHSLLLQWDVR